MANLQSVFKCLANPLNLPHTLPIAHLTVAKWFKTTVDGRELKPRECRVFHKDLLYFSYGGIFHRLDNKPKDDPIGAPIAFVFSPALLNKISWYYPYDTGAADKDKYGLWSQKLRDFERFKLEGDGGYTVPCKLVYHIYGSNQNYMGQYVLSSYEKNLEPLSELFEFFNTNLTSIEVDHRKCVIECQLESPVSLLEDLLWVGFPESYTGVFADLWNLTKKYAPKGYPYPCERVFTPDHWAHSLHQEAMRQVIRDYISLPGGQEYASAS